MDEEDPAQCRALESSLWEIKVCTACDGFGFTNESSMTLTTTELWLVSARQVSCWLENNKEGISYAFRSLTFFSSSFLQTLQKHYHPDVAKAAVSINTPLSEQEDDISEVLEITTYEVMLHFQTLNNNYTMLSLCA